MDGHEFKQLLLPLFDDLEGADRFPAKRPLLAHYTTIQTVEKIAQSKEF